MKNELPETGVKVKKVVKWENGLRAKIRISSKGVFSKGNPPDHLAIPSFDVRTGRAITN